MAGIHDKERKPHVVWFAAGGRAVVDPRSMLALEGATVTQLDSVSGAAQLGQADPAPDLILVDPSLGDLPQVMMLLRSHPDLSRVPVVYASKRMNEGAFEEASDLGADDLYWAGDERYLPELLETLRSNPRQRTSLAGRIVFILHADQTRRRLLGRVFRNAGFHVVFGSSQAELVRFTTEQPAPDLVLAARAMLSDQAIQTWGLAGQSGAPATRLILLDEGRAAGELPRQHDAPPIASMGEDAPGENALFLANELLSRGGSSARRSRRLLCNALCSYRRGTARAYRFASLYNVNRTGVYVRTLVPPQKGESVHLEFALPETGWLHLAGVVAWSQGALDGARLAPPGFGVELLPSHCAPLELDAYVAAYEVLADRSREEGIRISSTRRLAVRASQAPETAEGVRHAL